MTCRPGRRYVARHFNERYRREVLVLPGFDEFGDARCLRSIAKDQDPPLQQATAQRNGKSSARDCYAD